MNGCERGEVLINTLPVGACFELRGWKISTRGIVREHRAGSTVVKTLFGVLNWCTESQVVPRLEQIPEQWLNPQEETNAMAKKQNPKKAPAEKKVNIFEISAKEPKALLSEDNKSQLAAVYKSVLNNGPCEFAKIFAGARGKFRSSEANPEKIETNVRTYLYRLVKAGNVKRVKRAAEAPAKASEVAAATA